MSRKSNTPTPESYNLFKYRKINKYLLTCLKNNSIWFSDPESLNDPFDCQVNLSDAWTRSGIVVDSNTKTSDIHMLFNHPNGLLGHFEEALKRTGICSFSLDGKNPLLWAHYGDEYKGIQLLYSFSENFLNNQENISLIERVEYKSNNITKWLIENTSKSSLNLYERLTISKNPKSINYLEELIVTYLKSKSPKWAYEKEVRMIRTNPGELKIPYGSLHQICFGLRTKQKDIEDIKKIAKKFSGCQNFYKLEKDKRSDYGIKKINIS